jgi:hypothetical protein
MATLMIDSPPEALERRLAQGADILFDMERRGETGPEYQRWLGRWIDLLEQYEAQGDEALVAA